MPGLLDLFSGSSDQSGQSTGLLGGLLNMNPMDRALLAASAAGLDASGPQLHPVSFGQVLGRMVNAGIGAYDTGNDRQQEQAVAGLKMRSVQTDLDQKQALLDQQRRIRQRSLDDLQTSQGIAPQVGGTTSGLCSPSSSLTNPSGLTPASHMSGSIFTDAAAGAGLSDDMSTLNSIVGQVNQGQDPLQAALSIAGKGKTNAPDMSQAMASAMPGGPMSPKIGGPDWLQSWQGSQQSAAPSATPAATPTPATSQLGAGNLTQQVAARLTRQAQIHAEEGDMDGANKLYEQATKFMPEVNKIEVGMDNGKPVNVITFKDGTQKVSRFAPKPDIHFADDGQHTAIPVNGYTGATMGPGLMRQATPGEVLNSKQAAARLAFDKSQADGNQDAALDPLAVHIAAQQYLAGDAGALQNYGRGAQGAQNLNQIRAEIAKQATAAGMSGSDIAAKMAEFAGTKAGQRTAGTRSANIEIAANEAGQLAPLALAASDKVTRSGFLPFGKAQVMFDSNTNDPNLRQFAMANQALVNAYGQVMSRGGAATVNDKQHAQELLSTAIDQPSYKAAVGQLMQEITAARAAPGAVRSAISAGVSGRAAESKPAATTAPASAGQFSIKTPDGRTFNFPNARALANFKLTAGLQ